MTATATLTDDQRRHFLRYTNTGQWPMLQRFPISDDLHTELLAQMLVSTPQTVRSLIRSLHEEARTAAARMLTDHSYREAVANLPFRPDDRIAAVGDSITADRLGWFELLAASLGVTGEPAASLINLSISGNTTADALERFDLLEAARPSLVLLMLGTNDARAHGRTGSYPMATTHETERNLRALVDLITHDLKAQIMVITPPAVDQSRIDTFFGGAPLHWQAAAVAEVAGIIRQTAPAVIDVHQVTQARVADELLEPDGVHPTPAGQRLILTRIVEQIRTGR